VRPETPIVSIAPRQPSVVGFLPACQRIGLLLDIFIPAF